MIKTNVRLRLNLLVALLATPSCYRIVKAGRGQFHLKIEPWTLTGSKIDRLKALLIGADGPYAAAIYTFEEATQFEAIVEIHMRKLVAPILS